MRRAGIIATLALVLAGGLWCGSAGAQEFSDADVEKAVETAKDYLWRNWAEGHWDEIGLEDANQGAGENVNYGGRTALCAYALLAAGESAQSEKMKKTLEWLCQAKTSGIYARAFRASALAALGRNSAYVKVMQDDVAFLLKAADKQGAYGYLPSEMGGQVYDNSNGQIALLAVWAASNCGLEIPAEYWKLAEKHWADEQNPDGGWGYSKGHRENNISYGSMTAAGLASMFICFDNNHAADFVECKTAPDLGAIGKGLEWLDANFDPQHNPNYGPEHYYYYLYALERVGLASGYKYFGKKDWYKLAASSLVGGQADGGSWGGDIVGTSFGLLFLARGRQPVLFNKLQYEGTWNSRPRDLANLTRWISASFEKPVNWQIVNLAGAVEEWHDAPILYISGWQAPKFSDEELAKLAEFVHQGGLIFSEAAGSRSAFSLAMQRYYLKMFPGLELKRLPEDHPVYNVYFKLTGQKNLLGISNGVRLLVVHSPEELSLAWQLNQHAVKGELFRLAANIYFVATDKGSLRRRGVSHWPSPPEQEVYDSLKLVQVKHAANWQVEPAAWKRFGILLSRDHHLGVELAQPVELEKLDAQSCSLAVMTGAGPLAVTDAQKANLKKFITDGGSLIVDSAGGDEAFAASVRKLLEGLLEGSRLAVLPPGHPLYTKVGPVVGKVAYRPAARQGPGDNRPRLEGLSYKGRLAVVFSPEDLTAGLVGYAYHGLKGYEPASAYELMRNAVLYLADRVVSVPSTQKQ
jgi:hypothetical protein